jgi:predicted ester cyclase
MPEGSLSSCSYPARKEAAMSTEANKAMIRRMGEAFNTRDLTFLDHCFSPHFVLHTAVTPGWSQGLEGARQTFTTMLTTAPDIRVTIENLVSEGEKVAVRWTFRGTHTGESPTHGPPTGKPFTAVGIAIYRFTEGKIEED